ncbi:AIPR family protein [Arthrobacter sp. HY1533]|uniref:AIPR family protein n=1 Tax=Arthrobacter sp. HY1533 TaxID=2970919 RepID=UPI0022B9F3BA|nr:AIPR family protein [Arthrobacter sp. HY1533]
MNLDDFHLDLQNTVNARAAVENDYTSMAFMAEVSERFAEAGEVENFTVLQFEGKGQRNKKLAVHAYDLDDADESVSLAVLLYANSDSLDVVTATDAKKRLTALEGFLSEAVSGQFTVGREESSAVYQLAVDLNHRGRAVSRYRLYLVTNGRLSDRIKEIPSSSINGIPVDFHLWDLQRLHQVQESQQGREALEINLTKWVPEGLPILEINGDSTDFATYMAAVPGALVADLYGQYGSRLLEGNVRSFLSGRGKVNKGIKATIHSEPEMFMAYNNGITATATGLTRTEDGLRATALVDLQIVNGGQTTASLFYVAREGTDQTVLRDVYVPMKLVVVDPTKAVDLVPKISRFANSQNRVSEADFFSNSPFHIRLEELARRLLVPARPGLNYQTKWYYERTRGQYLNEKNKLATADANKFLATFPRGQVITKTDVAKYAVSWAQKPHLVSAGAQKNFVAFAESIAKVWESSNEAINEQYFRDLVAKAIMYEEVRKAVAKSDWYDKGYLANIVTYAIAKLSLEIDKQAPGNHFNFSAIWNLQTLPDAVLETALASAKLAFEILTAPSRRVANVTEWAKSQACWEAVRTATFELPDNFKRGLVDTSDRAEALNNSKTTQRIDNSIDIQKQVFSTSKEQWEGLREFALRSRIAGPTDIGILDIVTGRKTGFPSERQCARLIATLTKAREKGFAQF